MTGERTMLDSVLVKTGWYDIFVTPKNDGPPLLESVFRPFSEEAAALIQKARDNQN